MTLCLFAKLPRAGQVKTRLARALGEARALELARAFLEDSLLALRSQDRPWVLALDDPAPPGTFPADVRVVLQGPGDLGERMTRVLGAALREGPLAVALGADTPGLPWQLVRDATALLERAGGPEAVLGPCSDGGYYLLGARRLPAGALAGVRWSTEHAYADTRSRLAEAGLAVDATGAWFDVDEAADLERLRATLAADATMVAPATRRALGLE